MASNVSTKKLVNELENAVKSGKKLLGVMRQTNKVIIESAKDLKEGFKGASQKTTKGQQEFNKSITNTNKLMSAQEKLAEQTKKTEDQLISTKTKLAQVRSKENQELLKNKVRLQEANKQAKQRAKESLGLVSAYDRESRRLNELRKKYKNLAVQERENSKEAKSLLKNITKLDKTLKGIDKTVGQSQRNVGNYGDALSELQSTTGLFGREIAILQGIMKSLNIIIAKSTVEEEVNTIATTQNTVAKKTNGRATKFIAAAQKAMNIATGLGTKALKAFKIALAGTGVGAIVIALGSLVAFLTSTQEGMDKVERATSAVSTTFDVLLDRLSGVGSGLSKIFSGDFAEGLEEIKGSFTGIGDEIAREVDLIDDLTKGIQKLRIETAQFTITRARLRKEINELRLIGEDENKDIDLRIESLRQAFKIEEEIANERSRIARENALRDIIGGEGAETRAKAEQLLNDVIEGRTKLNIKNLGTANSTTENLQETSELIAEIINSEAEQFKKQRSELAKINSLLREKDTLNNKNKKSKDKEIKQEEKIVGLIGLQSKKLADLKKERDKALTSGEIKRISELIDLEQKELDVLTSLTTESERNIKAERDLQELKLNQKIEDFDDVDGNFNERIKGVESRVQAEINLEEFKKDELLKNANLTEKEKELILEESIANQREIIEKGYDDIESINSERSKLELDKLKATEEAKKKLIQDGIAVIDSVLSNARDKQKRELDEEIDALDSRIASVKAAIKSGNSEASSSLAEFEKQKIEAEKKKEDLRKKEIRDAKIIAGLQLLAANSNEPNAVGKTLGDVSVLIAGLSSIQGFIDGTENVAASMSGHKVHNGKDGYIARFDGDEGILNPEDNARRGSLSNHDLVELGHMHNTGKLNGGTTVLAQDNTALVKEVKEIVKAVKGIPVSSHNYDAKKGYHEHVVKSMNKIEVSKFKAKNIYK